SEINYIISDFLVKYFKFISIIACKYHCGMAFLMVYISKMIYRNCTGKTIDFFQFDKGFLKCMLNTESVGNSGNNLCSSSVAHNIFAYTCTAYCAERVGEISGHRRAVGN